MALSPSPTPLPLTRLPSLHSSSSKPPLLPLAFAPNVSSSCSATLTPQDHSNVPKMQPFSRSRISRFMPEPSLLEKAEHALSDRCMILEGDAAYRCWEAVFDFEDLKEQYAAQCSAASSEERPTACQPLERFESLIRQSNGVVSLIENVRMLAKTSKMRKAAAAGTEQYSVTEIQISHTSENQKRVSFPEPGALPPTEEELELERSAMMPESSFTRLFRTMGGSSWDIHPHHFETA